MNMNMKNVIEYLTKLEQENKELKERNTKLYSENQELIKKEHKQALEYNKKCEEEHAVRFELYHIKEELNMIKEDSKLMNETNDKLNIYIEKIVDKKEDLKKEKYNIITELTDLKLEFQILEKTNKKLEKDNKNFIKYLCPKQFKKLQEKNEDLEDKKELEKENISLKKTIIMLECEIEDRTQEAKKDELTIDRLYKNNKANIKKNKELRKLHKALESLKNEMREINLRYMEGKLDYDIYTDEIQGIEDTWWCYITDDVEYIN